MWTDVATKGSRGLGESFVDGWWTTDDLVALLRKWWPLGLIAVGAALFLTPDDGAKKK